MAMTNAEKQRAYRQRRKAARLARDQSFEARLSALEVHVRDLERRFASVPRETPERMSAEQVQAYLKGSGFRQE